MFPYKARKPAWGSAKPRAATDSDGDVDAEVHLGGDPGDAHTIGGNLQRAILLDMLELRRRYGDAEESAAALSSHHASKETHHAELGSSFARFKACFREARFGAIHTRTIPPRVDRGKYVQLLYSSCLYLLEESFRGSGDGAEPLLSWEDNSHPHSGFNVIYAAFLLYALHRTNVLPEAPQPRSHTKRTRSGKLNEQSLREAWSMLTIGSSNAEEKHHRRAFRTGVRIDRWNYLLLLRLRDVCLARVDGCDVTAFESERGNASSWRCNCGLARDAATIIDKMLFDDAFFEYCEYHGPQSLEGLAGSPNFYRAHWCKGKQRKTGSSAPSALLAMNVTDLSAVEDDNRVHKALDMQNLSAMVERHRSHLTSVAGQLQASSDLQPKQRELVAKTLEGVRPSSDYMQMLDKLSAPDKLEVREPSLETKADPPAKEQATVAKPHVVTFSESLSSALCDRIQCSLLGLEEDVNAIRAEMRKKAKARRKSRKRDRLMNQLKDEIVSLGDLDSVLSRDGQRASEQPPTATPGSAKRAKQHGNFLELEGDGRYDIPQKIALDKDDDVSIATGAGKNALLSLLQMAGEADNAQSEGESLSSDDDESSGHDTNSESGRGKRALQSLLAQTADGLGEDMTMKRARKSPAGNQPKASKRKSRSQSPVEEGDNQNGAKPMTSSAAAGPQSDEEFSVAADGAGQSALAALLSNAGDE
ncbi:hypothetical protein ACHAXT_003158 [Thalassiosira profunda]